MPIVDRREFGGRFTVRENSQRLANYRYLEIQLMEMLGGWSHTTPYLAMKATFGYHVYDHAQAADRLGERLEQLRSQHESQEPGSDEFARLCEKVWNLPDVVSRLTAVYRVLEPHLVSSYVYHADATDPLADTPTVRLLRQLASTGQSHVAWGQAVLETLAKDPQQHRRALDVQAELEALLVESGGVTGQGVESHWLAFHSTREADKPQPRQRRSGRAYRYTKHCEPLEHLLVEPPFWFSTDPADFQAAYTADDPWSLEGFRHQLPPTALRRSGHHRPHGQDDRRVPRPALGDAHGAGPPDVGRGPPHRDRGQGVRGRAGRQARLWPVDVCLVVDAERERPAAPPDRHQQLGRAQPDARLCASGASTPRRAAFTASPSCATTSRPMN